MASNLSISISANTGEAKAQISLVTAELNQTNRALAALAKQAAASGTGVTDAMRGMAAQAEAFRLEQAKLFAEMKETSVGAFGKLQEAVKAPLEGLAMLRSSLRETAEIAGLTFAVDKIREFVGEMGELGEHAVNTAAALGTTAEQYQQLSESMELVGGDAEALIRAERQLSTSAEGAISNGISRQADAFRALGINAKQFAETLRSDPVAALKQLAEAYKTTGGAGGEAGPFGILLGRSLVGLVPYLRDGAEGVDKLQQSVKALGSPSQDTLERLDKMGEATNRLKVATENYGIALADLISGPGTRFLNWLDDAAQRQIHGVQLLGGALPADSERYNAGRDTVAQLRTGVDEYGSTLPSPPSNEDLIKAWLGATGYSSGATAAILGNAQVESGFNPGAQGPGGHFGLFQWDQQRQQPLGGSTDIATQMELMDRELGKLDPAFRTATGDVAELTKRFEQIFERSGGQREGKREAAASAVTLPEVAVTAKAPTSVNFQDSEAEKKALDEQLRQLEAYKKQVDATFDYEIAAARDDEQKQADLAKQKAAADQAYYAKRQALIDGASKAVQKSYESEGAEATEAATRSLQAQQKASEVRVEADLRILQNKLRLDQEAEASDLRTAELRAKTAGQTADTLASIETGIVASHRAAQEQILADEARTAESIKKLAAEVAAEQAALQQQTSAKITEINQKAAEADAEAWHKTANQISDSLANAFTDALTGTKSWAQSMRDALKSVVDDSLKSTFKDLFNSILGGGQGTGGGGGFDLTKLLFGQGGLGSLFSGGGGGSTSSGSEGGDQDFSGGASGGGGGGISNLLFGSQGLGGALGLGSIFGSGGLAGMLGLSSSGSSGILGSLFGGGLGGLFGGGGFGLAGAGGAAGDMLIPGTDTALLGAGATAAAGGGGLSSLLSFLPALFAFEKGGIVPSAAGGWSVPQLGSGGTLAQLHSNEMVLPANISQGFQNMLSGGGSGGGGGHTFNMNISAMDGASVMSMGPKIVASINKAIRNGSPLFQPS